MLMSVKSHLHGRSIGVAADLDGQSKLSLEDWQSSQLAREDKVEQTPQLCQPILDRGASHNDSVHLHAFTGEKAHSLQFYDLHNLM